MSNAVLYDSEISQHYDRDFFNLLEISHDTGMKQLAEAKFDGKAALDIGCGTGSFLSKMQNHYPQLNLYGLDPSQRMLDIALSKVLFNSKCGTIKTAGYSKAFDLITCHYVLAYEPLNNILKFSEGNLAEDGMLLIATTTLENFPNMLQHCDFIDLETISQFVSNALKFEDLMQDISENGAFNVVDEQTIIRELVFEDKETLLQFVFNSGWLSDISIAYKDQITELINNISFPFKDSFKSHSILLRKK